MGCCISSTNKQNALNKIAQRGEQIEIQFQPAHYAGGKFGNCANDGIICLTNKHICFVGACCCQTKLEIPVNTIKGIQQVEKYHRQYRSSRQIMVLKFENGDDCGFHVRNFQQWADQLQKNEFRAV